MPQQKQIHGGGIFDPVSKFQHHLFVCVNERPLAGRPSCAARGGREVLAAFAHELAQRGLDGRVGLTSTGCLGPCFDGPTCVVYPEGVWYAGLTPAAATTIISEHIEGHVPVARHRFDWNPDDGD